MLRGCVAVQGKQGARQRLPLGVLGLKRASETSIEGVMRLLDGWAQFAYHTAEPQLLWRGEPDNDRV